MAKNFKPAPKAAKPIPAPVPSTAPISTSVEPGGNDKKLDAKLDPTVGTPLAHAPKEPLVSTPDLEQAEAKIPQENLRMADGSKPITAQDFERARGTFK